MLSIQLLKPRIGHPGRVYVTKMAIRKSLEHIYIKLIS